MDNFNSQLADIIARSKVQMPSTGSGHATVLGPNIGTKKELSVKGNLDLGAVNMLFDLDGKQLEDAVSKIQQQYNMDMLSGDPDRIANANKMIQGKAVQVLLKKAHKKGLPMVVPQRTPLTSAESSDQIEETPQKLEGTADAAGMKKAVDAAGKQMGGYGTPGLKEEMSPKRGGWGSKSTALVNSRDDLIQTEVGQGKMGIGEVEKIDMTNPADKQAFKPKVAGEKVPIDQEYYVPLITTMPYEVSRSVKAQEDVGNKVSVMRGGQLYTGERAGTGKPGIGKYDLKPWFDYQKGPGGKLSDINPKGNIDLDKPRINGYFSAGIGHIAGAVSARDPGAAYQILQSLSQEMAQHIYGGGTKEQQKVQDLLLKSYADALITAGAYMPTGPAAKLLDFYAIRTGSAQQAEQLFLNALRLHPDSKQYEKIFEVSNIGAQDRLMKERAKQEGLDLDNKPKEDVKHPAQKAGEALGESLKRFKLPSIGR